MVNLSDPYVAYCFDEVVYMWGRYVEGKMAEAVGKKDKPEQAQAKRQRALQACLASDAVVEVPAPGRFRDPAAIFSGR